LFDDKEWKKNRSPPSGVDLTRNWAYEWKNEEEPSADKYAGPAPMSEPETKHVADIVKNNPNIMFVW
jgi:hypothetical protein